LAENNSAPEKKGYISIYQITKEKTRKDLWGQLGERVIIWGESAKWFLLFKKRL
jgi:hypothetical protein